VKYRLQYVDDDGSGTVADLDFFIYKNGYTFGDSESLLGYSRKDVSGGASTTQTESISLSSVPKGHYLFNVLVYTGGSLGDTANYKIQQSVNGGAYTNLCPDDVP
jgi:hypothetical protein